MKTRTNPFKSRKVQGTDQNGLSFSSTCVKVADNDLFNKMVDLLEVSIETLNDQLIQSGIMSLPLLYEVSRITDKEEVNGRIINGGIVTTVKKDGKFVSKQHSMFTIWLPYNLGLIRICPVNSTDVEITRIFSDMSGQGTRVMQLVTEAFHAVKSNNERLTLECCGSVGMGSNRRDMDIKDQARFFRKFGFKQFGKYDPTFLTYELK